MRAGGTSFLARIFITCTLPQTLSYVKEDEMGGAGLQVRMSDRRNAYKILVREP